MRRHKRDVELCQKMPAYTVMGWIHAHHPEVCTESGAIDASLWPTAQDAAQWVHEQTKHLFPPGATCVLLPDLEYAKRWLE